MRLFLQGEFYLCEMRVLEDANEQGSVGFPSWRMGQAAHG